MLRFGRLVFVAGAFATCAASIAACSLAVDTSGLSGGPGAAPPEGGTPESGTTTDGGMTDGGVTDGALPDAGFSCVGGTHITSFDGFATTGAGTIMSQGGMLTARASTTAKDEEFSAAARQDFPSAPRQLLLAYDLTITESDVIYFEPGCSVYFDTPQQTIFRQTFASNSTRFSGYLNLELLDGGDDSRQHDFPPSPSGESTRHIELKLTTTAGTSLATDVSVGGVVQSDALVLPDRPSSLFVRCGIAYGAQTQPGSFTTNVVVRNFSLWLCP
jgi:hypothetical protein